MKKMQPLKPMTKVKTNTGQLVEVSQETLQSLAKMYFDGIYFSAIVKDINNNTHIVLIADLVHYK